MNYYPHGWYMFKFIITPEELHDLLQDVILVITNRRVLKDYTQSSLEEYLTRYNEFYQKSTQGHQFIWQQDHHYFDLDMGITRNLNEHSYSAPFTDACDLKQYKTADFNLPCVDLAPFVLYIDQDQGVHTNYSSTQFCEFVVGLQLQYPRNVYLYKNGKETARISTEQLDNILLFEELSKQIKKICSRMKLQRDDQLIKPNVWVSEKAKGHFRNTYFIKHFNCEIL